jgi:3-oxoacyl-[acyl-carrier-protein] synthase-3
MDNKSVGILGLGTYLPEHVRTNDHWPAAIVDRWLEGQKTWGPRQIAAVDAVTEGVRKSMAAIQEQHVDPFQGSRERRVIADDEVSSDLEVRAARAALASAGCPKEDIDVCITHAMVPDYICVNQAGILGDKLGLSRRTMSFSLDGVCTSFLLQLVTAAQYVRGGIAKRVLTTQSSACTRIAPIEQQFSPHLGDGATAAVLGEVPEGLGFIDAAFQTHGDLHKALCLTVPGGRWYDEGNAIAHSEDRSSSRKMQLTAADICKELMSQVLERNNLRPEDVRFFASHQACIWLRRVTQEHSGLINARSADTFSWTASLSSANIPMQVAVAAREGILNEGDLMAFFTVASGMTAGVMLYRWSPLSASP